MSAHESVLTHVMPYLGYGHEWTCGPDRVACCQFDFMRVPPSRWECSGGQPARLITESNMRERYVRVRTLFCSILYNSTIYYI